MRFATNCVLAALAACVSGLPAQAQTGEDRAEHRTEHRAEYRIAFLGMAVARASFATVFEGGRFTVTGELSSAGVGNLVGRTTGTTSVTGLVTDDHLQASRYVMAYASGDESQRTEITLSDGAVVSARLEPEEKRRRDDWVPVAKGDLQQVLDPITGLMRPAGADVCDRTLPIFDGETRFDIHLTQAGTRPFETQGFSGEAIVCTARAEPKSGYHADHSSVDFVRRANVEVWFGKNETAGVFAPVFARIPTKFGPVTVTATRFGS